MNYELRSGIYELINTVYELTDSTAIKRKLSLE